MKRLYLPALFLSFCCAAYSEPPKCADKSSVNLIKDMFIKELIQDDYYIATTNGFEKTEEDYRATLNKRIGELRNLIKIDSITSEGFYANQKKRLCTGDVHIPGYNLMPKMSVEYSFQSYESGAGFKASAEFITQPMFSDENLYTKSRIGHYLIHSLYKKEFQALNRAESAASAARAASATAPQDPQ